jgi:hypothetical protein
VIEREEHGITMLGTCCLCVRTPVHLGDLRARCKDSQGVPTEGGNNPWLERLELPGEERSARSSFRFLRIAVFWGSALHRVQDENLLAPESDRGQQIAQKAS